MCMCWTSALGPGIAWTAWARPLRRATGTAVLPLTTRPLCLAAAMQPRSSTASSPSAMTGAGEPLRHQCCQSSTCLQDSLVLLSAPLGVGACCTLLVLGLQGRLRVSLVPAGVGQCCDGSRRSEGLGVNLTFLSFFSHLFLSFLSGTCK